MSHVSWWLRAGLKSKIQVMCWYDLTQIQSLYTTTRWFCGLIHSDNNNITKCHALLPYNWAHLRSVPHNRGPGVSQLVSAWPLIIMSQKDITLHLNTTYTCMQRREQVTMQQRKYSIWIWKKRKKKRKMHHSYCLVSRGDLHPDSADSTSRRCVCSFYIASVHSLGFSRCRYHT